MVNTPRASSSSSLTPNANRSNDEEQQSGQSSSVAQFLEIVGDAVTVESATALLESSGWNVENALAVHFAQHDEDNGGFRGSSSSPYNLGQSEPLLHSHEDVEAEPQSSSSASSSNSASSSSFSGVVTSVFLSITRAFGRCTNIISRTFMSLLRLFNTSFLSSALNIESYGQFDFNSYFQNQFGSPKPAFYSGPFLQACEHAKETGRVLLVYLHQPSTSTSHFQTLFQNEVFIDLLSKSAVIWATFGTRLQAQMLRRQVLHGSSLPHLSVFAPTSISSTDTSSALIDQPFSPFAHYQAPHRSLDGFHLVGYLEGDAGHDVTEAIRLVSSGIDYIQNERIQSNRALARLEDDRKLRQEQDRAYAAAVERDNEIAAKAKEEEQRRQRELLEMEAKQRNEELKRKQRDDLLLQLREQQLLRGRNFFRTELKKPIPTKEETIRIRVRLPDSVRLERQFRRDSPILNVFLWIDGVADLVETMSVDFLIIQSPMSYIEKIILKDDPQQIQSVGATPSLPDILLGEVANPNKTNPNIPPQFYLSAPFRTQKLERPTEDETTTESQTLRELGFTTDLTLYLHYITVDDDNDEEVDVGLNPNNRNSSGDLSSASISSIPTDG